MLIGAKEFATANNGFAPRQMHAAMGTAHHVLADFILWRFFPPDRAAIAPDEAENNPGGQSKKYQFDRHRPAPVKDNFAGAALAAMNAVSRPRPHPCRMQ